MVYNNVTAQMEKPVAEWTNLEVHAYRRFPAHLTTAQMREEIEWHQNPAFTRVPC